MSDILSQKAYTARDVALQLKHLPGECQVMCLIPGSKKKKKANTLFFHISEN